MSSTNKTLITIVGPTAIGKTSLSIALAKHFNTEIISCDSRQFYKEMNIGTAVPTEDELNQVQHHFIQDRSIHEDYNVGQFEKDALQLLDSLFQKHNVAVMVGGSGLYVDAVIKGFDHFPSVDSGIRKELTKRLEEEGIESLQNQLKELDEESYNSIAIENPQRLTRALEICISTGKTYSSFKNTGKKKRNFNSVLVGLTGDRVRVYERINLRVDLMMKEGLLKEAKELYPFKHLNALQTVGYKELFNHFSGEIDLEFAISEIKKNTRRFAKRQFTWFKKYENLLWFDYNLPHDQIIASISDKL